MILQASMRPSHLVVALSEVVDVHTEAEVAQALAGVWERRVDLAGGARVDGVVLDLSGMPFLTAAGMRVLMQWRKALAADGAGLCAVSSLPLMRTLFRAGRISVAIALYTDVRQALAAGESAQAVSTR